MCGMAKKQYKKTYIREWRMKRKLSLRGLASRMESEPGVELISYAQLGRIEKGQQPYSQPILEAAADALNVSVTALLTDDPSKDSEVIDLLKTLSDEQKNQALNVIKALSG